MKRDCEKANSDTLEEKSPKKQECPLDHQFPLLLVRAREQAFSGQLRQRPPLASTPDLGQ